MHIFNIVLNFTFRSFLSKYLLILIGFFLSILAFTFKKYLMSFLYSLSWYLIHPFTYTEASLNSIVPNSFLWAAY